MSNWLAKICSFSLIRFLLSIAGFTRVPGDEEEDGADDIESEFSWRDRNDTQYVTESMLHAHMSYGRAGDLNGHELFQPIPNVPLLTNGQMVLAIFALLGY